MSNKNSTIEINGKRYDADSGALLTPADAKSTEPVKLAAKPAEVTAARPKAAHQPRHAVHHSAPHKPEASKILMRQAVRRPGPSLKRQVKAHGHLGLQKAQVVAGPARQLQSLQHAKHVAQSPAISHFSPIVSSNPQPTYVAPPTSQAMDFVPVRHQPVAPKPINRTEALLEKALSEATAHQQKPLKRRSHAKRQMGIGLGAMAAVALFIGVAVHNLSGAQLQVASAKAGFSAKLPSYLPAGFSQSGLTSGPGQVAAQFASNNDARTYTITQKATSWNSAALRDNFVATVDPHYSTTQSKGLTIYLYGDHNATWVNHGVWFQVSANGSLTDGQLVSLAASL